MIAAAQPRLETMCRTRRRSAAQLAAAALTFCWLLTAAAPVWAVNPAMGKGEGAGGNPSYLVPYFLVGLCIAFGVMVVVRPGRRDDKEKRSAKEEFADDH